MAEIINTFVNDTKRGSRWIYGILQQKPAVSRVEYDPFTRQMTEKPYDLEKIYDLISRRSIFCQLSNGEIVFYPYAPERENVVSYVFRAPKSS